MPADGFHTADQLRALGERLSDAADAFSARLKQESPELDSGQIYARLQEEQRLRGMANQLYFEASQLTIQQAVAGQKNLDDQLQLANAKIKSFHKFQNALDLVADLIALGGAVLAGKPSPIVAAIGEVAKDVQLPDDAA